MKDKRDFAAFKRLTQQAEQLKAERDIMQRRAAETLFRERNPDPASALSLDLHFLSSAEAIEVLATHLPALAEAARAAKRRWVRLIAGAGLHSVGTPVLYKAAEDWLRQWGAKVRAAAGEYGTLEVNVDSLA